MLYDWFGDHFVVVKWLASFNTQFNLKKSQEHKATNHETFCQQKQLWPIAAHVVIEGYNKILIESFLFIKSKLSYHSW